ncbi:MAG: TerC family protein [Planctomycetes bacterium]|nr:TerC family protein [Planctomycetota bacterium]
MEGVGTPGLWAGFIGLVLVMLALDLGVFHRKAHVVGFREALGWSVVWVALSLVFAGFVWWRFGSGKGIEFLTGYLIEKSLSVDNIFVFVIIFSTLGIPALYQHRVLFWGIISALVLRAAMILGGAALLQRFHWLIYVFGGFLVLTGIRLFLERGKESHPEDGWAMRLVRRIVPSTSRFDGDRFFTVENGRRVGTPLLMALLLVEVTDVIFAVDSIPAIFAVTLDPFIVFTSNICAILGLRSLYFLLAGLVDRFPYLKTGLAAVLVFVGVKMCIVEVWKMPPLLSLVVICLILGVSVVASLHATRGKGRAGG